VPQVTEERELIRAQARYVRSSARKARLVLEHIRGKSAVEAQSILAFQTRAVARDAGKVLKSAIANAENNSGHESDELVVVYAYADEGPTLKRWRARARGRVNRIRKRTCHITITLSPALPGEIKPRPERRRPADEVPAETEKPKRSRRAAAPKAEAATAETATEETAGEPEAVEQTAADEQAEAKPKPRRKPAAKAEPEAAEAETEVEPEAAAEPEPEAEPEAAAEPEPEPEPEPAAEETSDTDTDDDSKEADS
jgi:large subunit ribosomal protein L22